MKNLKFYLKGRQAYLKSEKYADKLKDALSYSHPGARFSVGYNMRDADGKRLWDGRVSMFKNNTLPVGLLIGAYKELKEAGLQASIIKWKNRPSVKLRTGGFWEKSQKYEFQNQACRKILHSFSKGGGTVLSATGTGKTKLSAQVFSHIKGPCLFVVDQINLLYQSQKELTLWLKEEVGIVGNGKFLPKRVTTATVQTLHAHRNKKECRKWLKTVNVIFVDELHKQMSKRNFDVLYLAEPQAVIGLTATLQMKKKIVRWKVYAFSGPVIFSFPLSEGIETGVLSKVAVVQVNTPYFQNTTLYKEYKDAAREWVDNKQEGYWKQNPIDPYNEFVICNKNVTHKLIPALVKEALRESLAVIVLADRITHIRTITRSLKVYSPCELRGAVKEFTRQKITNRFEAGKIDLIVASRIFTKGLNIKRISLIIDAAELPNKDDAMQKLGRGTRLHEDKDGLIFISVCTFPERAKAGSSRRNAYKKSGVPVKVLDWEDAKAVIKTAKRMLK